MGPTRNMTYPHGSAPAPEERAGVGHQPPPITAPHCSARRPAATLHTSAIYLGPQSIFTSISSSGKHTVAWVGQGRDPILQEGREVQRGSRQPPAHSSALCTVPSGCPTDGCPLFRQPGLQSKNSLPYFLTGLLSGHRTARR